MPDHDRGCRTGNPGHVVVFGHPIAGEPQRLGVARQIQRIGQRLCRVPAFDNGRQIQNGKLDHQAVPLPKGVRCFTT